MPTSVLNCSHLEEIYRTGSVADRDGNRINPFPVATPQNISRVLYATIRSRACRRTIEIGMAYGLSTMSICQAHADAGDGMHTAIDPVQSGKWRSIGLLNVERAGLKSRLRFLEMRSYEALPKLLAEGEQYDFAFIDGSHLFDYALLDFFYIDRMLPAGGCILFDDVWMPSIRRLLSFVLRNRSYVLRPISAEAQSGMAERIRRVAGRLARSPLEGFRPRILLLPSNVCLLEKTADDSRPWQFHRSF